MSLIIFKPIGISKYIKFESSIITLFSILFSNSLNISSKFINILKNLFLIKSSIVNDNEYFLEGIILFVNKFIQNKSLLVINNLTLYSLFLSDFIIYSFSLLYL